MNKKDLIFTFGLTLLMGVMWVVGEIIMNLWIAVSTTGHILWFIGIIVVTLVINVWHSMKDDESDRTDPKREKYKRKTKKN